MSHSDMYNPKPREVWCPKCNEYTIRDDANPRCANDLVCNQKLITVIYSLMTGNRLTRVKK